MDQINNLKSIKAKRDNKRAVVALDLLKQAAQGDINLMPPIIECVRVYCSIGEICGQLRNLWGEYRENF
jgi:methylmalonyl-CoA mutase, N-terminal domain